MNGENATHLSSQSEMLILVHHYQVVTSGYFGRKTTKVVQESNYGTNRVWTNNPTFLLSGQLTGKTGMEIFLDINMNYYINNIVQYIT